MKEPDFTARGRPLQSSTHLLESLAEVGNGGGNSARRLHWSNPDPTTHDPDYRGSRGGFRIGDWTAQRACCARGWLEEPFRQ